MSDTGTVDDRREKAVWKARSAVQKWHSSDDHDAGKEPDEVEEYEDNLLTTVGISLLLDQLIGATSTPYNNANSRIGVGDSATAEAVGNTSLAAATNKLYKVMDATFPSRAGTVVTWKSTFASTDANWAWQEWVIDRGTADSATVTGPILNRRVQSMGTKSAGSTWALTVTVSIA